MTSSSAIETREEHKHAILQDELEQLRAVATKAERLERENRNLRQELIELREQRKQDASSTRKDGFSSRQPLSDVAPNQAAGRRGDDSAPASTSDEKDWKKECAKITNKYVLLNDRYEKLSQKARQFRDDKDGWLKYAEMLERKVQRLDKKLQEKETKPRADEQPEIATGERALPDAPNASFISNPESASGSKEADDTTTDSRPNRARSMPPMPAGEETMSGDDNDADELPRIPPNLRNDEEQAVEAVKIKDEPSSDGPTIVFERSLRKRKHTDDKNGMPPPFRKIKTEPHTSSDPVVTGEATAFSPHESIDLDDDVAMPTPKKQRPLWMQNLRGEEVTPNPRADISRPLLPRPLIDTPPTTPMLGRDMPGRLASSEQPKNKVAKPSKDGNWTLKAGVADVAEDNSEALNPPEPRRAGNASEMQRPSAGGRLQTLLNHLTPQSDVTPVRPTRPGTNTPRFEPGAVESPLDGRQGGKALVKDAEQVTPAPRQRQGNLGSSNKPTPVPLRNTPVAQLRVSDFKVNPKYNNGYKYAFEEVVRNKADRAQLMGCTDYNCCGRHYRALAESELSAGGTAALSRAADVKMMEMYLGGAADQLKDMTREERAEVWIRAKAQDMANRFGKHRHRFTRQASPPGYWNPDFPTTQEMEENREEAARRERQQVEERWREATRPGGGGRWLFRDE